MLNPAKYFKEVNAELKKVSWPNRQQTINMTLLVVLVSAGIALYLTGIDFILQKAINFLMVKA